jgi:hypothetical protein
MDLLLAEQEKRKKAKKKSKEEEPEINPAEFRHLPIGILSKILRERLSHEDCNAGSIFDCLECEYWPDSKFAIELLLETIPKQNLQVMVMKFQKDLQAREGDEDAPEVCTNYRFARRKMHPE